MAFDWTKVEGYREDMSADEKLALLDNAPAEDPAPKDEPKDNPAPKPNGYVSKKQFDEVSSQLAAYKKQLRARMTEDEQKEADRAAEQESMRTELETLRKEKTLNNYRASYLAQGYDEQMALDAATAMAEGDMDTVFAMMKKQQSIAEKNLRASILKDTPRPPAGDDVEGAKNKREMAILREAMGLPPLK